MKKIDIPKELFIYHQKYCESRLKKIIKKRLKEVNPSKELSIKKVIYKENPNFFKNLIQLTPVKLRTFHSKVLKKIELIDSGFYEAVGEDIKNMYTNFSKFQKDKKSSKNPHLDSNNNQNFLDFSKEWKAYVFTFLLNVKICPYCNLNSIMTYYAENNANQYATVRPTLDHFYPKNKFPWLAMSVYNLIPSCTHCNSSIKKTANLSIHRSIHPYMESVDNYLVFTREYELGNPIKTILGEDNYFSIIPQKRNNAIKDYDYYRAKNTVDFFHLSERYSFFKDMIQREIRNNVIYTEKYLNNLEQAFPGIGKVLSKQYLPSTAIEIDQILLGKLTKDLLLRQHSEMYYLL